MMGTPRRPYKSMEKDSWEWWEFRGQPQIPASLLLFPPGFRIPLKLVVSLTVAVIAVYQVTLGTFPEHPRGHQHATKMPLGIPHS